MNRGDIYWQYRTAALDNRFVVRLDTFWHGEYSEEGSSSTESGDRGTIVYAWHNTSSVEIPCEDGDEECEDDPDDYCDGEYENCDYVVSGGAARRVVRGGTVPIPGVPPSQMIAASGRRIAVALSLAPEVEVRNAVTGAVVSRFGVDGYVADLALSSTSVLVRVQDEAETRLERHDPTTGALVASIAAPRSLWSLALEGDTVIYGAGRSLGVWRSGSAVTETLWTGTMGEAEPSISGDRIVWVAGPYDGPQRILTLRLPPSP